jgi:hypothetical protein
LGECEALELVPIPLLREFVSSPSRKPMILFEGVENSPVFSASGRGDL